MRSVGTAVLLAAYACALGLQAPCALAARGEPRTMQQQACVLAQDIEIKAPHHFDEVNVSSVAGCCSSCTAEERCHYWSFKASDVPNAIACKRFDAPPTLNKTDSAFVSGSAPQAPIGPPPPPGLRLRVQGSKLIAPDGSELRLTGFNWPLAHVHTGDGAMMKAQLPAANVARVVGMLWDNTLTADGAPTHSDCMTSTAPYFKEECFKKLDNAVRQATDAKVWVILTARSKFGAGQNFDSDPQQNVFHNATLRNMLYTAWAHVAAHYSSWDYIAAYEILSEPRDKVVSGNVVNEFYDGGCKAVQAVDPATPCMVGPAPYYKLWNFDARVLLPNNKNVIYTFDYFVPPSWTFGELSVPKYPGTYPCGVLYPSPWDARLCVGSGGKNGSSAPMEFNKDWTSANFGRFAAPLKMGSPAHAGVPVFVNQWSVVHGVSKEAGRYQYMADVARQLQELDIGWAWWVWRGGGDGWAHGSSEFVYDWSNGTIELDTQAFDAVRPYM